MAFRSNKESRTRQILDYLDQLKNNHSDILDRSTSSLNSSNTQRWLHDIGLRKLPPTPSRSIRTPSRLSSIIAASKFKSSFHQRPASHLSPTSSGKVLERSIEVQPEPEDVETSHVRSTPYLAGAEKSHKSVIKSVSGQNVARTNTFSARVPELSVDRNGIDPIPQEELQSVKPVQVDVEPGFLTKNRAFAFSKPIIRGPEVVEEEEMEQTLDEPSSPSTDSGASSEGEIVDDEVAEERTKDDSGATSSLKAATNTETSSSDTSPNKSVDVPVAKKWECPTCMLQVDADKNACPCCMTKKPDSSVAPAKKWECPSCMLQVDADKNACPCCMTKKDGTTASNDTPVSAFKSSTLPPPDSKFKFGLTSSISNSTPSASNATTFTNSSTPAPVTFQFGLSNTNGTKETTPSIPAFNSGSSSSATAPVTTASINGSTESKSTLPAFGLAPSSSATTASFNFSSTAAPTFKFGGASTNGTTETTSSGSLFGSTNPVTTSAIGGSTINGSTENKPSLPAFGLAPSSSATTATFSFNSTPAPATFQFGGSGTNGTKETTSSVPTFGFGSGTGSGSSGNLSNFNFTSTPAPPTFQFGAANPNGTKESTPSIPMFGSNPTAPASFNFTGVATPPTFQFGAGNANGAPGVLGSTPFSSIPDANPFMPTSSGTSGRKVLAARRKLRSIELDSRIYLFTSKVLASRAFLLEEETPERFRKHIYSRIRSTTRLGRRMKVPNRRQDERRPSARYISAAAEPLLVIDSPPSRSRSGSRANVHDNVAAVAPSEGGALAPSGLGDNPKKAVDRTPSSWSKNEPEEEQGLIASLKSYPKGVFFMLGNEFCERFSFYGMRAILIFYFKYQHNLEDSIAKFLYHGFISMAYLSPLVGSIAADNYFGRFKVILWVSLFYVLGHLLLSVGALPFIGSAAASTFDFSGLIVIALATGGIKPCVSAFAADQFNEHQHRQRAQFFSFFYFSINAGSLLAIILTPILRGRVSCFGSQYCFPLAFGVPGVLMLVAFLVFLSGWRFYKITPPGKGNVVWKVVKCIGYALKRKVSAVLKRKDKATHWVDYASPKYNDNLISGVKSLLAVSLLFVPVVFFWALFDQQGSTWVIQASQMDGRVGSFTILPDQMNTFNPLIVLIMVPICEAFIYPFVRKFVEVTPLRKMAAGGILAAVAFTMAGFLQLRINATLEPRPPSGKVFVQNFGPTINLNDSIPLSNGKNEIDAGIYMAKNQILDFSTERKAFTIAESGDKIVTFPYGLEKAPNGQTDLILLTQNGAKKTVVITDNNGEPGVHGTLEAGGRMSIQPAIISSQDYTIYYGDNCDSSNVSNCEYSRKFVAKTGAVNVLYLGDNDEDTEIRQVVQENSVNVLWQLPQFFVITLGEVLFSVTGLEFSYSQAAPNMKSVLQAMWLLTTFAGNVVDMAIAGARVFSEPALEFFFYSLLMFVVVGIFILIAINYQYVDEDAMEEVGSEGDQNEKKEHLDEKAVDAKC